jgi:hypothetical protein
VRGWRTRPRTRSALHRRVGGTELADGTPIHHDVARRLSCDADIRIMTHGPDGSPCDVGRRQYVVPPRLRRLVFERDRCCTHPGCGATTFLDVHHVIHWEDGGRTDLANLRLLCDFHHRLAHGEPVVLRGQVSPFPELAAGALTGGPDDLRALTARADRVRVDST